VSATLYPTRPVLPAKTLYALVCTALLCNLLDGMLTIAGVSTGAVAESNPLMAGVLTLHPVAFMLAKVSLVSLGLLLLWRLRNRPAAAAGIVAACGLYALVVLYHVHGLLG
jgi:hypothetical protein